MQQKKLAPVTAAQITVWNKDAHRCACVYMTWAAWADQVGDTSVMQMDCDIAVPASQTHSTAAASEHVNTKHAPCTMSMSIKIQSCVNQCSGTC